MTNKTNASSSGYGSEDHNNIDDGRLLSSTTEEELPSSELVRSPSKGVSPAPNEGGTFFLVPTPMDHRSTSSGSRGVGGVPDVEYGRRESASKGEDELALAVPVEDEEPEDVYDVASPMDPTKEQQHFYQNGAFLCCLGLMCCVVMVVIVVVLSVVLTKDNHGSKHIVAPTMPPTAAPTTSREVAVKQELTKTLGSKIDKPDTPYRTALDWILYKDPMQLDEFANNLVQRYILAYFYYETSQHGPWVSCNPPVGPGANTSCIYYDANRDDNNNLYYVPRNGTYTRWLSPTDECQWANIQCINRDVVSLDTLGQNLTGTLIKELVHLNRLAELSLGVNHLSGTIPEAYGSIESLVFFEVSDNQLTGTVPLSLFKHSRLLQLNPSYNMITGTIPTEIGLMTSLNTLYLFQTRITGTIPTEVGNLEWSLKRLILYDNLLSGTIATELFRLTELEEMNLSGNAKIFGTLPTEVGLLRNSLKHFSMARTNMNGTEIPTELWQLTNLVTLDLEEAHFSGTLSTEIGLLTKLTFIRADRNQFTGTIPTELGQLDQLELLWIHRNELSGSVPSQICALRGPDNLQILNADCGGSNPLVACPCCTGCCDRNATCQLVQ